MEAYNEADRPGFVVLVMRTKRSEEEISVGSCEPVAPGESILSRNVTRAEIESEAWVVFAARQCLTQQTLVPTGYAL
jgi:hypothetical protein